MAASKNRKSGKKPASQPARRKGKPAGAKKPVAKKSSKAVKAKPRKVAPKPTKKKQKKAAPPQASKKKAKGGAPKGNKSKAVARPPVKKPKSVSRPATQKPKASAPPPQKKSKSAAPSSANARPAPIKAKAEASPALAKGKSTDGKRAAPPSATRASTPTLATSRGAPTKTSPPQGGPKPGPAKTGGKGSHGHSGSEPPQRGSSPPPNRSTSGNRQSSPPPRKGGTGRTSAPPPRPAAQLREPPRIMALPLPLLAAPKRQTVEERYVQVEQRLTGQTEEFRRRYIDSFDMSWIYHDSALEGVVYTFEELRAALGGEPTPLSDSSLQPTYDDIRRHKEAIDFVRDFGEKKRLPVTVDIIKKIYLILHPEEGDIKTVKYRKDIPQHRLYFHEYAQPDKIAYKVRQIVDWLSDPETKKTRNGVRIAARAHYDLLRVYPFPTDSGKVSRLFMNLLLMRSGLPPSIVHSTERQRYYEALKGSATTVLQMVQEAVENALSSVEKLLDEHETKKRAFVN